jgi:hypothetical protein
MGRSVPLGGAYIDTSSIEIVDYSDLPLNERVIALESQILTMTQLVNELLRNKFMSETPGAFLDTHSNKDRNGIPYGTTFIGYPKDKPAHYMVVKEDGYYIGDVKFKSPSGAAAVASGIPGQNGFTFWKTYAGKTIREEYRT